ncbi:hypothetical protein C8T65DRAFT_122003 [Cerioporus squamosus]|nr:hypothetical protein C8T65DRAFT_122003 [Cerioporus squamosus]
MSPSPVPRCPIHGRVCVRPQPSPCPTLCPSLTSPTLRSKRSPSTLLDTPTLARNFPVPVDTPAPACINHPAHASRHLFWNLEGSLLSLLHLSRYHQLPPAIPILRRPFSSSCDVVQARTGAFSLVSRVPATPLPRYWRPLSVIVIVICLFPSSLSLSCLHSPLHRALRVHVVVLPYLRRLHLVFISPLHVTARIPNVQIIAPHLPSHSSRVDFIPMSLSLAPLYLPPKH